MTSPKMNTGKSQKARQEEVPKEAAPKNYDPRRAFNTGVMLRVPVTVTGPDGRELQVSIPTYEGQPPEEAQRAAIEYAQLHRRVNTAWKPDTRSPESYADAAQHLAGIVADIAVSNLAGIIMERFGENAFTQATGVDLKDQDATGTWMEDTSALQEAAILRALLASAPAEAWVTPLEQDIVAGILEEFEKEHRDAIPRMSEEEYGQLFSAAYQQHWQRHFTAAAIHQAEGIARAYLEALNAAELPLADLVSLLQPLSSDSDTIAIPTGQWSRAMQEGIIRRTDLQPFDKQVTHSAGRKRHQSLVRVDARLDPSDFNTYPQLQAETPQQEQLLADMRLTLAGWKEHNAALLKLHLDLTDMAYQAARTTGEERPEFIYHLGEALERQGYARNDKRRGYHPDTLQGLRQRLEALYSHRVMAWATTPDRKQILARSPYWIMEEEYSVRQLPLDLDVVPALAAGSGTADAYTAVRIRPGRWWEYAEMSERRYPLPAGILRLPTDGRGRERERYALLIATFLALHVRRNQRQHAGKTVILKTGTLLEEAGITTWEEFDQMHPTQASRMRDHLHHSSEETGVFPLLRELDAFDVQVTDQEAFYASGRGWRPKFWESRLEIQIPRMGIVQKKKRGKRSN